MDGKHIQRCHPCGVSDCTEWLCNFPEHSSQWDVWAVAFTLTMTVFGSSYHGFQIKGQVLTWPLNWWQEKSGIQSGCRNPSQLLHAELDPGPPTAKNLSLTGLLVYLFIFSHCQQLDIQSCENWLANITESWNQQQHQLLWLPLKDTETGWLCVAHTGSLWQTLKLNSNSAATSQHHPCHPFVLLFSL